MLEMLKNPQIQGFTTNPTLMRQAGIKDYKAFAQDVLKSIRDLPVSFEVFADELDEMEAQAYEIASWAANVVVKIPVTNTLGVSTAPLIRKLAQAGIALNITAILTLEQVRIIAENLSAQTPAIVSVFAGRIADTGRDPIPFMEQALALLKHLPKAELLWASPRELLNIIQAHECGCHIITATPAILNKMFLFGKDLAEYSLETVQMFYNDARASGFNIPARARLAEPA
jgi:transaldolase